jgi:translocation and assembly module TamB
LKRLAALLVAVFLVAIGALAQDDASQSDNGFLLNQLENRLSAPGRQIRLSGVTGALSSRARIARITISDDRGAWLEIDNVELDWSRLALLRGRVAINRLSAERIAWLRRAETPPVSAADRLPKAEATPFSLPELPVSIQVSELRVGELSFAEEVLGRAARLSVTGALNLTRGTLQSNLEVRRLDEPGGELTLTAGFSNATRQLDVDLDLREPAGGLVASLLRIEGEPAIELSLAGSGPLDQVDLNFTLDANGDRLAAGVVALRSGAEGLGFDVDFNGTLSPLVPAPYRDFFAGESNVEVRGVSKATGGVRVEDLRVAGAVLDLRGNLETGTAGLTDLTLTGTLGDPAGPAITLPVPGARTRLNSAALHVNFGNAARWNGLVVLDRLEAADLAMEDVTLRLGGLAQNLEDPARRNVTVNVEGLATGLYSSRPEVAQALGNRIDLFADVALPPDAPIAIRQLQLSGNGLAVFSTGQIDNLVYTGRNAIRVADLAIFAGIANRPLTGAIDLRANGSVAPLSGGFDLTFQGGTTDLVIGNPRVDPLLAGATTISGRAVRDESGIRTENLRIENPQLSFASNGQISSTRSDIGFEARLADLGLIDPRLGGALTATGRASGTGRPIDVSLQARIPSGRIEDRTLANARLGFDGQLSGSDVSGTVSGAGQLDGLVLSLGGDIAVEGESRRISGLDVRVGPNRLSGDLAQTGNAPATGRLTLAAPDISPLAAFALVQATGAVNADIRLDAAPVGQSVALDLEARDVVVGETRLGSLTADLDVTDALGRPLAHGTVKGRDLALAGVEIASLAAEATTIDQTRMRFTAESRLAIGTLADLSGELGRLEDGFSLELATLRLRHTDATATLTAPATITVRDGSVALTPLALDFGTGSLTAQGSVNERFDIDVAIRQLPLALANTIQPALGLAGTIDGTARVTGPRATPNVRFDVAANQVASAMTRGAGLPPLSLTARGTTSGSQLNLDASVAGGGGLAATARGAVPLGAGTLNVAVDLQSFPVALVDRLAGNRGLRGTVSGRGQVTGTLADPRVTFDLRGQGLTTTMLAQNAIPPINVTAAGNYHRQALTLTAAQATGAGGIDFTASGRVPFTGAGLDLRAQGTLPLAVINPLLEQRSAQASGLVRLNLTARGALTQPQLSGTLSLAGGTFVDPTFNLRLEDLTAEAAFEGNTIRFDTIRARVPAGGTIVGEGRITIDPAAGLPADFSMRLNDVRYTDGAFVTTRFSGNLAISGPLTGGALLSGRIDLGRTEVSIAEGLGGGARAVLEQVRHIAPSPPVALTIERATAGMQRTAATPSGESGIRLDVQINAPNQIFVRGRGLDVEVGGQVRVQGTTNNLQPIGQFELRRGRLVILAQRIEFDSGSVQLIGNLDPQLHFVASTRSQDATAIVTVTGRASAPEFVFSSEPPLPQDEVLARILFNRSTENLSAFQLAQLAGAAAELAGTGGPGLLSQLRSATGLDDLDIITQDDGRTALRAGKYLSENLYVDVETDTEGASRAAVNLEINDRVTARGSVGSDGNSTIGIFYERDY